MRDSCDDFLATNRCIASHSSHLSNSHSLGSRARNSPPQNSKYRWQELKQHKRKTENSGVYYAAPSCIVDPGVNQGYYTTFKATKVNIIIMHEICLTYETYDIYVYVFVRARVYAYICIYTSHMCKTSTPNHVLPLSSPDNMWHDVFIRDPCHDSLAAKSIAGHHD